MPLVSDPKGNSSPRPLSAHASLGETVDTWVELFLAARHGVVLLAVRPTRLKYNMQNTINIITQVISYVRRWQYFDL